MSAPFEGLEGLEQLQEVEIMLRPAGHGAVLCRTVVIDKTLCSTFQLGAALIEMGEDWVAGTVRCRCPKPLPEGGPDGDRS